MAEAPLPELDIYFITQGLTSAAWEALAPRVAERPGAASLDPNELRKRPRPYELMTREARKAEADEDSAGLRTRFAGGTVEISGEAMAHTRAPAHTDSAPAPLADAGPEMDEITDSDEADTETDSSPSGDTMTPDLGERVF
jgi:hypothetical protein